MHRPAGSRIHALAQPGDHVVVCYLDRIARSTLEFARIVEYWSSRGINLHFVNEQINLSTAAGKFQANIRAAVAQFQSDLISERTKEALHIKRMQEGKVRPVKREGKQWQPSEWTAPKKAIQRKVGTIYRYERVSSDEQYTSGLGLKYQSISNEAYAKHLASQTGAKIADAFVEDAISSFRMRFEERPCGKKLMETLKEGDDLIIYRGDRAWRNLADASDVMQRLMDRGVNIHLVNEGVRSDVGLGKHWIGVMAALGQLESGMKSRRSREIIERLREQGRPVGGIPKGFKEAHHEGKSKIAIDLKESCKTASVLVLREELGWSLNQIRDYMMACRARDSKKPMVMKNIINHKIVIQRIEQAKKIRESVPPTLWEKIRNQALESIQTPFDEKYWRYFDWEYPFNTPSKDSVCV